MVVNKGNTGCDEFMEKVWGSHIAVEAVHRQVRKHWRSHRDGHNDNNETIVHHLQRSHFAAEVPSRQSSKPHFAAMGNEPSKPQLTAAQQHKRVLDAARLARWR